LLPFALLACTHKKERNDIKIEPQTR
jgi:hypothetical protein